MIYKIFEVWTLFGIGQFLTICTCQLVEFLGSELQSSGPCHIVFLIKLGPNNNLKVTNVDRNEPMGFYGHSKLTNFWEFRHFRSFLKSLSPLIDETKREREREYRFGKKWNYFHNVLLKHFRPKLACRRRFDELRLFFLYNFCLISL